ncbi:D-alanyl-D-alanine carboxypeptidase [Streptomyces cylindrosporus]|uniref:serine-type D-Ala-D-Ala carboxypeptidase n=1 Tax=Streptomyces cylindrosporus TaxID=2927583 RepID=A0ABS9Y8Y6_9ACTN|nr:D-alanyl-D-alanine carboxypeptidase [Streptomyces cylindrosporus]MCI3272386.1 D-alanyl-D-alanine carboxypeptidase [Streptomyces cylindrosporus]
MTDGERGGASGGNADGLGDARLRAAVAAWVRSGDTEGAKDATGGAEGGETAREAAEEAAETPVADADETSGEPEAEVPLEGESGSSGSADEDGADGAAATEGATDAGAGDGTAAGKTEDAEPGADADADEASGRVTAGTAAEDAADADAEGAADESAPADGDAAGATGASEGVGPVLADGDAAGAANGGERVAPAPTEDAADADGGGAADESAPADRVPALADGDAVRAADGGESVSPAPSDGEVAGGADDGEPDTDIPAGVDTASPEAAQADVARTETAAGTESAAAEPTDAERVADEPADARPAGAPPAADSAPEADAIPEDAILEDSTSGDSTSGDPTSEDSALQGSALQDSAPQHPAPEDATPEDATPAKPTPTTPAKPTPTSAPAPADGDSAPQGPPAPDDESGTGGAGGRGKGVDQPTAVFKRPKPQVDQPTTMLKLGDIKADPERTSKFVALKPLDDPATKKPRPAPAEATAPVPQVGPERTTQQPLPPKPPLDLLAELTNTPPPPQTPVRTIVRRVKIWTPLVLLLAVVFAIVQAVRPLPTPTLALTAEDSYTFEGTKAALPWPSEGQGRLDVNGIGTMGTFGKQTPVAIGSVAKAMTAYIVLKDHPLKSGQDGPKITVDALAEKEAGYYKDGESTLTTVKEGDVLTEKEALSAIMIPSANNIARLLARWDAGTEAAFIKKMNDTAKDLGMTGTTYTDASGLKETTVSTASDQVKLGNELVKIPALTDITKLPTWVDPSGKKWDNYNRLVPYNGAIGIKTGTTTKAGGNLLFAATKEVGGETVTVVGAILGQHTAPIIDTVNAVSKTAMLAAQDALKSAKILKKGTVVGYVDDKLGGHTPIVVTKDVAAVGWSGLKVKLSFDGDDVPHTAKAGTQVGTLTVGDGSNGAVKVPVALRQDLAEPGFTAKLTRLG